MPLRFDPARSLADRGVLAMLATAGTMLLRIGGGRTALLMTWT
jgi:hypothetical protein